MAQGVDGYLAATSRKLDKPLAIVAQSSSAASNTLTDTAMYSSVAYSLDNRLTPITKAGQTTAFSYDAGWQRVSRSNAAAPEQARLCFYASGPELLGNTRRRHGSARIGVVCSRWQSLGPPTAAMCSSPMPITLGRLGS